MKKTIAIYIRKKLFTFDNCIYIHNYIFIANPANILHRHCIFSREFLIVYYEKNYLKSYSSNYKKYCNFITNETSNIWKKQV